MLGAVVMQQPVTGADAYAQPPPTIPIAHGGGGASLPSCVCIVGGFVSVSLGGVGCAVGGGGALLPSCECIVGGFVSVT